MAPLAPFDRTVVLSPHFDDAALSLAGLLPELPGPVTVVTVFGGAPDADAPVSWWDRTCGFSTAAEAYRTRLAEDAAACALMGAEQIVLDHPDGPYAAPGAELHALDDFLKNLGPGALVLAPLGSNQPDHEAVRHRAVSVLGAIGAPLPRVYADLPYTGHVPGWGEPGAVDTLAVNSYCGLAYQALSRAYDTTVKHELRLSDEQWAAKRAAVLCHGSQHAAIATDHGAFLSRTGPLSAELIWSLAPLGSASPIEPGEATPCD
ncbi:PIG-L deacetylase family protein [Streptomyces sp. NPDC050504]|uniref:PIG-L deacetylase family protein n=1 Tax=Streptomyces sp. NPDC050504 TaxID=3365618 RepID=UPI0037A01002